MDRLLIQDINKIEAIFEEINLLIAKMNNDYLIFKDSPLYSAEKHLKKLQKLAQQLDKANLEFQKRIAVDLLECLLFNRKGGEE